MTRSVTTSIVLAALAAIALATGRLPFLVLSLAFAIVAAGELYRLARARGAKPAAGIGLLSIVTLLLVAHARGEAMPSAVPVVIAVATVLTFVGMLSRRDRSGLTDAIVQTLIPIFVVGLFGAYLIALRGARDGFRAVLALAIFALANDAVAAVADARRARDEQRVSWRTPEGLLAGTAATMLGAIVVALTLDPPLSWSSAFALAAVVAVFAPVGDRSRSMLEDEVGDGAGGPPRVTLLARIDALLFSSPAFFYAFRMLER